MVLPTDNIEFIELDLSKKGKGYEIAYIYYLYYNDILLYIGQAVNAAIRIPQHTDKKFNRAKYFQIPYIEKDYTEIAHIQHYNPFYNGTHADTNKQVKFIEVDIGYYFNKQFYSKNIVYRNTEQYIVLKPTPDGNHRGEYMYYNKTENKIHNSTVESGDGEIYWDHDQRKYKRKAVPIGAMPPCYIIPVGKYKGKKVEDINDKQYIKWYTETVWPNRQVIKVSYKPKNKQYSQR